jgi:hypothetical protein
MKPRANIIEVVKRIEPPQSVASQREDLHAGRDGDQHRHEPEVGAQPGLHARREHVVAPHEEADDADEGGGVNHALVAEDLLAGEAGKTCETMPKPGSTMMYTAGWL